MLENRRLRGAEVESVRLDQRGRSWLSGDWCPDSECSDSDVELHSESETNCLPRVKWLELAHLPSYNASDLKSCQVGLKSKWLVWINLLIEDLVLEDLERIAALERHWRVALEKSRTDIAEQIKGTFVFCWLVYLISKRLISVLKKMYLFISWHMTPPAYHLPSLVELWSFVDVCDCQLSEPSESSA